MRFVCAFALFSALTFSQIAWGQAFQGSLRGRVTDPKDAVVPLAKVTLIEDSTSVSSSTVTNQQGQYSFPVLKPSTYTLVVEAPGFKKLDKKDIIVATQSAVEEDAVLQIGAVTETINVTAEADLLVTAEASNGSVIDRQKLEDIPNLGRDPFLLARLSEGVVWTGNPKFDRMEDQSGQSSMSIAGGPTRANNYTLDGISITSSTNQAVIIPDQESIGEMKVQANTYDASMGRTGGGVLNATMRSGQNRMHGSAFGMLRAQPLLANTFFSNLAGLPIEQQPFKNYGDSLGGPIRIPKIYDGRNKTFFYVTTEGYRQFDAIASTTTVPTALERRGDFSQSLSTLKNGTQQVMYDPMSTNLTTGARTPFANNVIPASRLDPIGLNIASYFPLPTTAPTYYTQPDYTVSLRTQDRADQGTFKVDHELFPWLKLSGSYLHYGSQEPSNQTWPGSIATPGQTTIYRHVDASQGNAVATLNPTTVMTVRFGYNRFPDFDPQFSKGFKLTTLGFPASVDLLTPGSPDFPSITSDFSSFGGGTASWGVQFSTNFSAEVSKFMGKHSLKAGTDWRALHAANSTALGPSSFSFATTFTSQTPTKTVTGTGGGLATMLLGYPGGSITTGSSFNDYVHYTSFYIQDDYRVTPKLIVNFGFRGEHETNPAEENNKYLIDANLNVVNPLQPSVPSLTLMGQARYAGVNGNPNHAGNPLGIKAGPRIGIAYSMDSRTVFRGGWGIFWIPQSFSVGGTTGYSQSTSIISSTNNNYTPISSLTNPYPNGLTPISGNSLGGLAVIGQGITATDPGNRSAGYVEQMSFDVQRQVGKNIGLKVGYIGSHTLDQPYTLALNQLNPSYFSLGSAGLSKVVANPFYGVAGVPTSVALGSSTTFAQSNLLTQYPEYTSVSLSSPMGRATYYSFYGKGDWRLRYGLILGFTYTWSRNMSLGSPQNYDAPIVAQAWGRSGNDQPNSYSQSFTYQLPFGKGQMFLKNSNSIVNYVLGGWSIQSQAIIHTGTPLGVSQTNANTGCNGCGQYVTATGIDAQSAGTVDQRIYGWFNPAAFTATPAFSFGNVNPSLTVYSPGVFNFDMSMFKTVTIKEHYKIQFRAEALNVTNTVLFGSPSTSISSPGSFGLITSQTNFPRLISLGARITF